jgi:hypothetical protein
MRRIDVMAIGLGILVAGFVFYGLFQGFGLDSQNAGLWSQALLVGGLLLWVVTYLGRVIRQNMTYNQQLKDYEQAVLQKRLEELSPEELAQLQAEIDAEQAQEN